MSADRRSFPEPAGQSNVRVLHSRGGVTLTNEPDPGRPSAGRNIDSPIQAGSYLQVIFKGCGLLLLIFGGVFEASLLIATVFFDAPMEFNGQRMGKWEAVGIEAGFL